VSGGAFLTAVLLLLIYYAALIILGRCNMMSYLLVIIFLQPIISILTAGE